MLISNSSIAHMLGVVVMVGAVGTLVACTKLPGVDHADRQNHTTCHEEQGIPTDTRQYDHCVLMEREKQRAEMRELEEKLQRRLEPNRHRMNGWGSF